MQHTKFNLAWRVQIKSARRKFAVFAVPGCELLTHTPSAEHSDSVLLKWVINTKASRGSGCHNATPRETIHVQILFLQQAARVFVRAFIIDARRRYIYIYTSSHRRKQCSRRRIKTLTWSMQLFALAARVRPPGHHSCFRSFIALLFACVCEKCLCCINLWLEAFLDRFQ